ncbi:CGNR zinc finger domain-containing protein [Streptomyces sp. NPDC048404]|uniref:CGNR zinc finger domain-containing protein n=1 Tax=unclassified Streptomyces TaxID=2593676 RepID=UPI003426FB81
MNDRASAPGGLALVQALVNTLDIETAPTPWTRPRGRRASAWRRTRRRGPASRCGRCVWRTPAGRGRWCSMAVCGARATMRRYRARQPAAGGGAGSPDAVRWSPVIAQRSGAECNRRRSGRLSLGRTGVPPSARPGARPGTCSSRSTQPGLVSDPVRNPWPGRGPAPVGLRRWDGPSLGTSSRRGATCPGPARSARPAAPGT